MTEESAAETDDRIALTSVIVATYVRHNALNPGDLPGLIAQVHTTLVDLDRPAPPAAPPQQPAVSIKQSVTPDYLVCLEDGKRFKSLKRYLARMFQLTPDAYRAKWGLPHDYPMVAPNYAAKRAALAKANGLGRKVRG